jgi:TolB-like protein
VSLLAELKRRNVFRVAALYGAVAWLLLQVGDVVVEPLELPAWTMKVLIFLLAAGFVVAVVIAWIFELTPEGLKRDTGAFDRTIFASAVRRSLNVAIAVTLLVAAGWFVWSRFSGDDKGASAAHDDATVRAPAAHTLAVLPFASMSSNEDDGYFADGLSEELLNLLASIDGLKVAGRTSSFYFKGRNEDLRAIGRQLGVANILEGSVRRAGTRVRVTAQLINAEDGFHLWSETYDRELSDVLELQDDIGRKVADALEIQLLGDAKPVKVAKPRPSVDAEAYSLYLVARSKVRERGVENLRSALELFRGATQRDPAFANAYAGESIALGLLWINHGEGDPAAPYTKAEAAARKALELDPASSDANAAMGRTLMLRENSTGARLPDTRRYLEQAVTLDRANATAVYWLARFESREGKVERALELYDRALALDPLEFIAGSARAELLSSLGRRDEALAEFDRLSRVYPDNDTLLRNYAGIAMTWGQFDRALAISEQTANDDTWGNSEVWAILWSWGDGAGARAALERIRGNPVADWSRDAGLAGMDRDFEKLYRLDSEFAAGPGTGSAMSQSALAYSSVLTGRLEQAEELLRKLYPRAFAENPAVELDWVCDVPGMAMIRDKRGDAAGARRLAETALATWEQSPAKRDPNGLMCRARLLLAAGRRDDAIEGVRKAVDAGYRNLTADSVISLRDDAVLSALNGDPRYEAQWQRIEADLARQRAAYEAGKKKAAGA